MIPFRTSLAALMGLVVILAFNLASLRAVIDSRALFAKEIECNSFMANALALGAYRFRFAAGPKRHGQFLKGLMSFGILAVVVHLVC